MGENTGSGTPERMGWGLMKGHLRKKIVSKLEGNSSTPETDTT